MTDFPSPGNLKQIGTVRNDIHENPPEGGDWFRDTVSELVIDESLIEGLDGLENYSSIIVLWWIDRADPDRIRLRIHPRGDVSRPKRGLFATRTQFRPNRIGETTVKLLGIKGNVLTVQGLDAFDGSPVLDIKPVNSGYDSLRETGGSK